MRNSQAEAPARFKRNFEALPLTLEARFGLNARLGSSFVPSAHEQLLDSTVRFRRLPRVVFRIMRSVLELEHAGLGRVPRRER